LDWLGLAWRDRAFSKGCAGYGSNKFSLPLLSGHRHCRLGRITAANELKVPSASDFGKQKFENVAAIGFS
jgi:hypothetical protein